MPKYTHILDDHKNPICFDAFPLSIPPTTISTMFENTVRTDVDFKTRSRSVGQRKVGSLAIFNEVENRNSLQSVTFSYIFFRYFITEQFLFALFCSPCCFHFIYFYIICSCYTNFPVSLWNFYIPFVLHEIYFIRYSTYLSCQWMLSPCIHSCMPTCKNVQDLYR